MADESYPSELKYYKEHDWVRVEGDDAVFGITWFAQDALGEIVYVSLPLGQEPFSQVSFLLMRLMGIR